LAAQESPARRCEILRSKPGAGVVSAAAIQAPMPENGTLDRKQGASLAGIAPITRQSGQWRAKACITGGRKPLRDALYMPTLDAMRFNPDLKAKYHALRRAGKPAKVAIAQIMRNLMEMANVLAQTTQIWVPKSLELNGYSESGVFQETDFRLLRP
jgi:transposase